MPKEKKLLHARVQNPLFVRKTLLESAIICAEMAKAVSEFKKTGVIKNKHKTQLKKLYAEIKILRTKLEEHELPPLSIVKKEKPKGLKEKKQEEKIEVSKRKKQESMLEKERASHYGVLNSEISELKERIRNL